MFTRIQPRIIAILTVALVALLPVLRAPSTAAQNVDWMTPEQASSLNLSFPVMVPTWIPEPFGGAPSIQAGGGYYSLYWMIPGGHPTFLQITGEVGASMPVGSPADLNVRLEINASVQGYEAIHDVTSIYDNVWWIAGGVLYTVSSQNMTGTDSLSLANSLIALQAPQPTPTPVPPTPTPEPIVEVTGDIANASTVSSGGAVAVEVFPSASSTLRATSGVFSATGSTTVGGLTGGSVEWQAPSVSSDTVVEFSLVDDATGTVTATSSIQVNAPSEGSDSPDTSGGSPDSGNTGGSNGSTSDTDSAEQPSAGSSEQPSAGSSGTSGATESVSDQTNDDADADNAPSPTPTSPPAVQTPSASAASGGFISDGTAGPPMPRTGDGTAGPDVPAGSDGTGGARQVALP